MMNESEPFSKRPGHVKEWDERERQMPTGAPSVDFACCLGLVHLVQNKIVAWKRRKVGVMSMRR